MNCADTPKSCAPPEITVLLQPEDREISLLRPKTVLQLLRKLDIRRGTALVIREGALLTEDRQILPGERIIVRRVTSSG